MADYHPLDTRYKGPSTAYRGSSKRRDAEFDRPLPAPKKMKVQPATEGPWSRKSTSAVPEAPRRVASKPPPPPLPSYDRPMSHMAPPPLPSHVTPVRPKAGRRVLFGALIIGLIFALNYILSHQFGVLLIDPATMVPMDTSGTTL